MASVVELYDKFAKGFADKEGAPPQSVEEGSEHAYLMAHFHKARLALTLTLTLTQTLALLDGALPQGAPNP